MAETVDIQPYYFAMRHAQTGEILHLHIDPWVSKAEFERKLHQRLGGRPREMFDWVGVKRGDRVLCRLKRLEDGSWQIEIPKKEE